MHVSIDVSVQLITPHLFRCYRWAAFRQVVDDTDKSVRAILSGDQNVKFLQHIHGAYYVSVNSGYYCVNLRKWFQPLDSASDIKPTKKGEAYVWTSVRVSAISSTSSTKHTCVSTLLNLVIMATIT